MVDPYKILFYLKENPLLIDNQLPFFKSINQKGRGRFALLRFDETQIFLLRGFAIF